MIEIVTEWVNGQVWQLDVDQQTAIVLTKTFLELTDIEKRTGEYTKQFTLPKSDRNDLFFGLFGDPSSIGANWNSQVQAPAWVIEDTNIIIEGTLRLETTDRFNSRYGISVSGRIFSIKTIIGDALMSALDMSAWSFNLSDIDNTWAGTWVGGHMIFSVHDFGQGYGQYVKEGDPAVLTLQNIKVNTTPIRLWETIPTFRLNELLRMIFNAQSLELDGSWFSESEVEEIYVQADTFLSVFVPSVSGLMTVNTITITLSSTTPTVMPLVGSPAAPEWNDTTYKYTAPETGVYYWDWSVDPLQGQPSGAILHIQFYKNGLSYGASWFASWNSSQAQSNAPVSANAGDTIELRQWMGAVPSNPGRIFPYDATLNLVFFVATGITIDPSAYWIGHRQIDFIRSITQIFNLILWMPDTNKIRIDTWEYYMRNYGSKKNWSAKLNVLAEPVIRPINAQLRNPINVSLKSGDDIINKEYQRVAGRQYGSYREDTRIPFTQPAADALEKFAPGPTQEIQSTDAAADFPDFIIAKLYDDVDNVSYKPPGLQLFYYNGLRTVTTFYFRNQAGGGVSASVTYPYFSNFRLYSADTWKVQDDSLDLNFTYWTPAATGIVDAPSELGLYNRYFAEMMRERYDLANKILELSFVLDGTDIQNFNFADTIIITLNGTPVGLKILEIIDYSPTKKQPTKVKAYITFLDPDS